MMFPLPGIGGPVEPYKKRLPLYLRKCKFSVIAIGKFGDIPFHASGIMAGRLEYALIPVENYR
jgi:hypothetical protein